MATFPKGHYAHQTRLENAKRLAHLNPTPPPQPHIAPTFTFPNPVDLRGIPAVGQGISGHIHGTQPENFVTR